MLEKELLSKNLSVNDIIEFVKSSLMCDKTDLIYDNTSIIKYSQFPSADECVSSYPNPSGYGTGMEDSCLSGGTMLEACINLYERDNNIVAGKLAKRLANGLIQLAEISDSKGFLPRSISPVDGKSHYKDSSRDQYTIYIYSMHRYINSSLCDDAQLKRIKDISVAIATRAQSNVCEKNNFDMLTEDEKPSLATTMWGDNLKNHEIMRLPMIYIFAFETSNDKHWLDMYNSIIDKALKKSLPMTDYWHLYALHQMQVSHKICYDVDPNKENKEKHLKIMNAVSKYAEGKIDDLSSILKDKSAYNTKQKNFRDCDFSENIDYKKMGLPCLSPVHEDAEDFFTLQDCADILIVSALTPNYKTNEKTIKLFFKAFDLIDLKTHGKTLPIYFLNAYSIQKFKEA